MSEVLNQLSPAVARVIANAVVRCGPSKKVLGRTYESDNGALFVAHGARRMVSIDLAPFEGGVIGFVRETEVASGQRREAGTAVSGPKPWGRKRAA